MCLSARAFAQLLSVPLIPTIVAPNSLNLAISDTYIRTYFDKSHHIHSNGGENKLAISSVHDNNGIE